MGLRRLSGPGISTEPVQRSRYYGPEDVEQVLGKVRSVYGKTTVGINLGITWMRYVRLGQIHSPEEAHPPCCPSLHGEEKLVRETHQGRCVDLRHRVAGRDDSEQCCLLCGGTIKGSQRGQGTTPDLQ